MDRDQLQGGLFVYLVLVGNELEPPPGSLFLLVSLALDGIIYLLVLWSCLCGQDAASHICSMCTSRPIAASLSTPKSNGDR